MPPDNTSRHSRCGQTLILFTLAAIPLFGLLGLVVDVGWAYFRREAAKTAADAAAGAAASAAFAAASGSSITCSTTGVSCYSTAHPCPTTKPQGLIDDITAGCLYAQTNGFTNSGRQSTSFTSGTGNPPGFPGITTGYWVAAQVSENIPQLFSYVLGFPTATVLSQTVTGVQNPAAGGGGCIFVLGTSGSTLNMSGGTAIQSGCGLYVNSSSSSAIKLTGGAGITTTGTARTQIVGNWNSNCNCGTYIRPSPQTGVTALTDPWLNMAAPAIGSCTDGGNGVKIASSTVETINPGVICGGISVGGAASLTMNAGLYIVKNGISIGNSGRLTGSGVTIYLSSGGFTYSGAAVIDLSAPSSGAWAGVVYFQSRTNTTAATMTGSANQTINGLIYLPAAGLTYSGGTSTAGAVTTLAASTVSLTGSSYIKTYAVTAYSPSSGGTVVIQ